MTAELTPGTRMRAFVAAFAAAWGVVFFRVFVHLGWAEAVSLAALVAASYAFDPRTSLGRRSLPLCAGLFIGLGAWWVLDFGALSVVVGALAAGLAVLYAWLELRRG